MKPVLGIALAAALTMSAGYGAFAANQSGAPPESSTSTGAAAGAGRSGTTAHAPSSTAHSQLQGALKDVSHAHAAIGKNQDWNTALKDIRSARSAIQSQMKTADKKTSNGLKDADRMANRAESSIRKHSSSALKDLDALTKHLNQLAVRQAPIQAGGGKKGTATGTNQSKKMQR